MASFLGLVQRLRQMNNPPIADKKADALKFGILGAANIGPNGLFIPAKTHPDVVVQAVAARDQVKAKKYAQDHGIPDVKGSYQEMLDDPEIDCVYIPLPNTLHFEWATRALKAGKHVLLEKPAVINAAEAQVLFAQPVPSSGPVLLEATHSLFHPAFAAFLSHLTPPSDVVYARASILAPRGVWPADDMRFDYELGGGALADMGPYTLGALRMAFGAMPSACEESVVEKRANGVDDSCSARFRFPNGGVGEVYVNLRSAWMEGISPDAEAKMRPIVVDAGEAGVKLGEGQEVVRTRHVYFKNFALPTSYHYIQVSDEYSIRKVGTQDIVKKWNTSKTVKAYTFRQAGIEQPSEEYYTTWRFMLEQFVSKVRGRPTTEGMWLDGEFSIDIAKMIDMAYSAGGLSLRPSREDVHS